MSQDPLIKLIPFEDLQRLWGFLHAATVPTVTYNENHLTMAHAALRSAMAHAEEGMMMVEGWLKAN